MGNRNLWNPMSAVERKDPLGPVRLNQLHANARWADDLQRVEHFADGQHNALEVPWVLGTVDGTTGYMFDTAYGGGTITNPITGRFVVSVASGVATQPAAATLANVSDIAIESKPHIITWDSTTDTEVRVHIKELSSPLGAGNTWAAVNRDFDIAMHAPPQPTEASLLATNVQKVRRNWLTEGTTDWSALVSNQALARAASILEHESGGGHNVTRIAKAVWWGKPSAGPSFATVDEYGIGSISYVSAGIVEITVGDTMTHACIFPEVQPSTADEIVIVNARQFAATKFRLYTYAYSGGNWSRVDRSLFASMFWTV